MKPRASIVLACMLVVVVACGDDNPTGSDAGNHPAGPDSSVATSDSGGEDANHGTCSASSHEECAMQPGCGSLHGQPVDAPKSGTRFIGCVPTDSFCDHDETLHCVEGPKPEAALFVITRVCAVPQGFRRRERESCAANLPESCAEVSPQNCADAVPWCQPIKGSRNSSAPEVLGCMGLDVVCSDVTTCSHDSSGGAEYWFPSSCVPEGWIECEGD